MKKIKVLCICAKGRNRSRYLSLYLRRKGYSTKFGGIDHEGEEGRVATEKEVKWADVIIIVRKRLLKIFNKKFGKIKKKVIVLDVSDSKNLLPEDKIHLKELDHYTFQKVWTYPRLRNAIKPHLPFK